MLWTIICLGAVIIFSFIYLRGINNENYWKKRGVLFYDKYTAAGPVWQFVVGKKSVFEHFREIYKYGKNAPAVGFGNLFQRSLYITDPTNIDHVTQTDFQSFYHRGIPANEKDLLSNNVLFVNGPKWKLLRHKMTPLFTSAKLKQMYYIIDKSAQDFVEFLKLNPDRLKGDARQMHETFTRFCAAALSGAVFGIDTAKSTFDSPFRDMVSEAVAPTLSLNLKFFLAGMSETLFKVLDLRFFGKYEKFFIQAIKQVIKQREKDDLKRHDFAEMCVILQRKGTMRDDETGIAVEPTAEVLAAQAFFFFLAGVDPISAGLFSTMVELGRNPNILERVHEEVDAVFEKYNDQLSYDAVIEAKYLDRVLNESIRMYPPIGYLTRKCTKDIVLPVGNVPVEKGTNVILPIYDLHHDPKYYPNPDVFNPDRFLKDAEVNDMPYLPFGKGYRICIGERYSRLQLMSGLMHFLRCYSVKTFVREGGIKYIKEPTQVRIDNVDIEFVLRNK